MEEKKKGGGDQPPLGERDLRRKREKKREKGRASPPIVEHNAPRKEEQEKGKEEKKRGDEDPQFRTRDPQCRRKKKKKEGERGVENNRPSLAPLIGKCTEITKKKIKKEEGQNLMEIPSTHGPQTSIRARKNLDASRLEMRAGGPGGEGERKAKLGPQSIEWSLESVDHKKKKKGFHLHTS